MKGRLVYAFRLNNGVEIPEMGLGVYKMNAGKEMDRCSKTMHMNRVIAYLIRLRCIKMKADWVKR